MPDKATSFEHGSNIEKYTGFIGMAEFRQNLERIYTKIETEYMVEALKAAAFVMAREIQAATPVGKREYVYRAWRETKGGVEYRIRSKRPIGQARASVIIYQRRGRFASVRGDYLVGYEKKNAYYMYWYEYGRRGQSPRPFMRRVFEANKDIAFNAAVDVLKNSMERIA